MTPLDRVHHYATAVDRRYELVQVLPGGRALDIAADDGSRFVLKWDTEPSSIRRRREAIAVAERLGGEAGWPVPAFDMTEIDEVLYVRQGLMPGEEPQRLTRDLWDQVVALADATAGLGSDATSDWPFRLLDTLVAEPADPTIYCSHDPLRQHSDAGRALITRIEAIGAEVSKAGLGAGDDLMHWDLHPGNLLVVDGEISAVIDLDNAGPGPNGFDLITFALSSRVLPAEPGLASAIWSEARARVSDEVRLASVAHLVLRFSNWAMRTDHTEEADDWIKNGIELLGS